MQRLSGLDAGFLYMETPTQHLHTLKIAVLDPAGVPGGYSFERVKQVLASRLHLLPFRRRVIEMPLGVHHPVWIEDAAFDLDAHVRQTRVATPRTSAQLDEVISDIASVPLRRDRPLWEVWVVEGLGGGHVGFVAKIHHSLADGVKAAELLASVFDTGRDGDRGNRPRTRGGRSRCPVAPRCSSGRCSRACASCSGSPGWCAAPPPASAT